MPLLVLALSFSRCLCAAVVHIQRIAAMTQIRTISFAASSFWHAANAMQCNAMQCDAISLKYKRISHKLKKKKNISIVISYNTHTPPAHVFSNNTQTHQPPPVNETNEAEFIERMNDL